ncbi:MAG: hypothetical protein KC503_05115 [Myxococcales bacterium]|nr:hypothetical protein [Myxococcales bacterium]
MSSFDFRYRLAALAILAAITAGCSSADSPASRDSGVGDAASLPDIASNDGPHQLDGSPDYGLIPDAYVGDIAVGADAFSGDGTPIPAAVCQSTASPLVLYEIAVSQPDYLAIKNVGATPLDMKGYTMVMSGISPTAVFTVPTSVKLMPGEIAYVFEYTKGKLPSDINTGANIPFYDGPPTATEPNAVALFAPGGELLDYVAIGSNVNLPAGASFAAIPWPSAFDSSKQSFQRAKQSGQCPNFNASDWKTAPLTRP